MKAKVFLTEALVAILVCSCQIDYLELKRDKQQVIPETLEDYRAMLDNQLINTNSSHLLGEIGSDSYSVTRGVWESLRNTIERTAYIWADDVYEGTPCPDWNRGYERILYGNFVLEGLAKIQATSGNKLIHDGIAGTAHYVRGTTLFELAQLFCHQYHPDLAGMSLGLPLRLSTDINKSYPRANLSETYDAIIADLEKAVELLPQQTESNTRPSRAAAYGMLAKTYLQMGNYQQSLAYADSSLRLHSRLMDFNEIVDPNVVTPFPLYGRGNEEIVFYSSMSGAPILALAQVDRNLYDTYLDIDIRKQLFFREANGGIAYKGHYTGTPAFMFTGVSTSENYLIYAESAARLGQTAVAANKLRELLAKRYRSPYDIPESQQDTSDGLLVFILSERYKELVFRGVRWSDLRRFNVLDNRRNSIARTLGESVFRLDPESKKWTWPIPAEAVSLGGLTQNER